ncbi:hypothetical protein SDC9_122304 [bioreactor metagenome]|uniref:Uncharacterized protein n=1 Tax=bioreactor metagenome TaxID=1076179 RepID=A0A645CEM8_9ZZZZ
MLVLTLLWAEAKMVLCGIHSNQLKMPISKVSEEALLGETFAEIKF